MAFLTVNDVTLHFKQEGLTDGRTLVFLNSLGSDLRIWDGVVPHFNGRFQTIRIDKRGHGLSDCPPAPYSLHTLTDDVAALLDTVGVDTAVLIGDSVGGMMALDFGIRFPERAEGLVLCDTAAKIGTADYWAERIANLRKGGIEPIAAGVLERWFSPSFIAQNPAAYKGYYNMLTRIPLEGYIGVCEAIREADLRAGAAALQVQTLVLCGAEDRATTPDMVQAFAETLPNGRFALVPNAGHIPSIEQPAAVANLIDEFLKTLG
ncbi:MAG: 3-oxoadipate enol-lactonase [Anaerolineales bacterium]|nr:3-oxoadipate enol-lactonase [Anaerolineales bacterium]